MGAVSSVASCPLGARYGTCWCTTVPQRGTYCIVLYYVLQKILTGSVNATQAPEHGASSNHCFDTACTNLRGSACLEPRPLTLDYELISSRGSCTINMYSM